MVKLEGGKISVVPALFTLHTLYPYQCKLSFPASRLLCLITL